MIGTLVATSIVQGGPGLPVFLPAAYSFICHGEYSGEEMCTVPDPVVQGLLDCVSNV